MVWGSYWDHSTAVDDSTPSGPFGMDNDNNNVAEPADPPTAEDVIASGWFMKRAPSRVAKKGTTQKRFMQLHFGEIKYYAGEYNGEGVTLKGSIGLSRGTEVKVAGRQLAINTEERFWDLVAIDGEEQAREWATLIQTDAIGGVDSMEIDLLPGHGDFMFKFGKGLSKYRDKKRYFTLVYFNDNKQSRLRMNYYVDLAGRGRVPMYKKGFIAIDRSSTFERSENRLAIINTGFTWQLTTVNDEVAERWERILKGAVAELTQINKEATESKGKNPRRPVLAQTTLLVTNSQKKLTVDEIIAKLEAENGEEAVQQWMEEIENTVNADTYTAKTAEGQVDGDWFVKLGLNNGKKLWFELDGINVKYFTRPRRTSEINNADTTESAFELEKGSFQINPAAEVVHVNGEVDFYVTSPGWGPGDRFSADTPESAAAWANAISDLVESFGRRSGLSTDASASRPISVPRRQRLKSDATRPLSVYQTLTEDGDSDDEITIIGRAQVMYKYHANAPNEISISPGDIISLLNAEESDWWEGVIAVGGSVETGWFPSSYVTKLDDPVPKIVEETSKDLLDELYASSSDEEDDWAEVSKSINYDDPQAVKRRNKQKQVIAEILKTEENYVRDLLSILNSYIHPMRAPQLNLFEPGTSAIIFSNVEQLAETQEGFLEALRIASKDDALSVADCFIKHATQFRLHSTYCSCHPRAAEALEKMLNEDEQIWAFFESCRMLLDNALSVSALMLKPVQRICQYPMMLKELIGTCEPSSQALKACTEARDIMNDIAIIVNEEKRTKEELGLLFETFEGWVGPPLTVFSTELFHDGPLTLIYGSKAQDRHIFLFDNIMVIAKKHLVLNTYRIYGRLFTNGCVFESVPDGEYTHGKEPITNAFRVFDVEKSRWYMLVADDAEEKQTWIDAFTRERKKVEQNIKNGINPLDLASQELNALESGNTRRKMTKKMIRKQPTNRKKAS